MYAQRFNEEKSYAPMYIGPLFRCVQSHLIVKYTYTYAYTYIYKLLIEPYLKIPFPKFACEPYHFTQIGSNKCKWGISVKHFDKSVRTTKYKKNIINIKKIYIQLLKEYVVKIYNCMHLFRQYIFYLNKIYAYYFNDVKKKKPFIDNILKQNREITRWKCGKVNLNYPCILILKKSFSTVLS